MTKPLMNLTEVAERLGMPRRTLYNMVRAGRFHIAPVPGITPKKWLRSDIESLLASKTAEG